MEIMAPVTHFLPLTTIRRERVLPIPGKVMVRKGQKVSASDTVAEANLTPSHQLLEVARGLGLRSEQADEYMQVEAGTIVAAGDIIAGPVGITLPRGAGAAGWQGDSGRWGAGFDRAQKPDL